VDGCDLDVRVADREQRFDAREDIFANRCGRYRAVVFHRYALFARPL
jgi:hypothetical protein